MEKNKHCLKIISKSISVTVCFIFHFLAHLLVLAESPVLSQMSLIVLSLKLLPCAKVKYSLCCVNNFLSFNGPPKVHEVDKIVFQLFQGMCCF